MIKSVRDALFRCSEFPEVAEYPSNLEGLTDVPRLMQGCVSKNYFKILKFGETKIIPNIKIVKKEDSFEKKKSIPNITILKRNGRFTIKQTSNSDNSDKSGVNIRAVKMCKRKQDCNGKNRYICSKCGYSKVTKAAVEGHYRKIHLKAETLKCSKCKYQTYNSDRFKQHTSTIKGCAANAFRCKKCTYVTSSHASLFHHENTHKKRQHQCAFCSKAFHYTWCLKKHVQVCKKK